MTNYSIELFLLWVVRVVHRTVVTELARRNDGFTPGKTPPVNRALLAGGNRKTLTSKTLRCDGTATHQRLWSGTKTGKARVVPLSQQVVEVLKQHRKILQCLDLNTKDGLVFVTPRTHGHLYDSGLEKV